MAGSLKVLGDSKPDTSVAAGDECDSRSVAHVRKLTRYFRVSAILEVPLGLAPHTLTL